MHAMGDQLPGKIPHVLFNRQKPTIFHDDFRLPNTFL
jgi:hypothetical protein